MRSRSLIFSILCSLFAVVSCSSCHEKNDNIEPEPPQVSHTLLIYMMGDNSLSGYCRPNVKLLKEGLLAATEDINLVIYKDNRDSGDGLPTLFQLKRSFDEKDKTAKIDTIMLKEWNSELNSCDPAVFKEVVKTTFSTYNTEVKGIELWSHALSWLPSGNSRSTRYIGQDDNNFFELWDIRSALEDCPHLDYILCDACFTGMAEVAYELDATTDYVYGPITEIMGTGFPYNLMLPILADCKEKKDVSKALQLCTNTMETSKLYDGNGYTVTVLETAKMKELASSLAELRKAVPEKLETMKSNSKSTESQLQHYGRTRVGTRYHFYDFYNYVDYLAENGSDEVIKIKEKIYRISAVLTFANTPEFVEGPESITLDNCRGLGVSIPELFNIAGNESRLTTYYGMTKWGQALGY